MSGFISIENDMVVPAAQRELFINKLCEALQRDKKTICEILPDYCYMEDDGSIVFPKTELYEAVFSERFNNILRVIAYTIGSTCGVCKAGKKWRYVNTPNGVIKQEGKTIYPAIEPFTIFDSEGCIVVKKVDKDFVRDFVLHRNNVTNSDLDELEKWFESDKEHAFEVQSYRIYESNLEEKA